MNVLRRLLAIKQAVFRVVPLMRHDQVPFALKAGTVALGALIISPIDLLGDIPVLGMVDDVALLSLLAYGFVQLASRHTARAALR